MTHLINRTLKPVFFLGLCLATSVAFSQGQEPVVVVEPADGGVADSSEIAVQDFIGDVKMTCQESPGSFAASGLVVKIYENIESAGLYIAELQLEGEKTKWLMQTWLPQIVYISGFYNMDTGSYQAEPMAEVKVPFADPNTFEQTIIQIHEVEGELNSVVVPTPMGLQSYSANDCQTSMVWTDSYGAPRTAPSNN